jgi:hypothetical protein
MLRCIEHCGCGMPARQQACDDARSTALYQQHELHPPSRGLACLKLSWCQLQQHGTICAPVRRCPACLVHCCHTRQHERSLMHCLQAAASLERKMAAMEAVLAARRAIMQDTKPKTATATIIEKMKSTLAPPVSTGPAAGSGYEIMLQAFNWESHKMGWYKTLKDKVRSKGRQAGRHGALSGALQVQAALAHGAATSWSLRNHLTQAMTVRCIQWLPAVQMQAHIPAQPALLPSCWPCPPVGAGHRQRWLHLRVAASPQRQRQPPGLPAPRPVRPQLPVRH